MVVVCATTSADCVCRSRANGRCGRPNRWHVFRRAHRTEYTRAALSAAYRRACAAPGGDDPMMWCALAAQLGLHHCVPLDVVRRSGRAPVADDPESRNHDPCTAMLAVAPEQLPVGAELRAMRGQQWRQALRQLQRRHRFPVAVRDYRTADLDRIAAVVGETFFGREFVPALRRSGWRIAVEVDDQYTDMSNGAGYTGWGGASAGHWVTRVMGALVDRWVPAAVDGTPYVTNDGFPIHSRLEWVAHIVGHELVHCLHLLVCGHRVDGNGGHDAEFQRLNGYLLGALDFTWMPVLRPRRP